MNKKTKLFWKITLFILLTIIVLFYYFFTVSNKFLSTKGYKQMNFSETIIQNNLAYVRLESSCYEFVFLTTPEKAESIHLGYLNQVNFRPTTHDIMKSLLERYKIKPIFVKITNIYDDTYFAEITFNKGFEFLTLDIKPSDAIALAVRTKTPIYVNQNLAVKIC